MGSGREPGSTRSFFSYRLGEVSVFRGGKNAASLKQIRAALSFAYRYWDLKIRSRSRKHTALRCLESETLITRRSFS